MHETLWPLAIQEMNRTGERQTMNLYYDGLSAKF